MAQTWLGSWQKRIKLTVDSGDIDGALSDFPILVYLSTASGRNNTDVSVVFDELTVDGNRKKIAITTSNGITECYVEIEKWDDASEEAWLWVKVPNVASGADTILYLYYDAAQADNNTYVGDPNSAPAEAVWDANFEFVDHMQDHPDTSSTRDSTDHSNDGTKKGANEPIEAAGGIGDAQTFDGVDDLINHGSAAGLDNIFDGGGTIEYWVNPSSAGEGGYGRIGSKGEWIIRVQSLAAGKVKLDFIVNWDGVPPYKQWITTNTEVTIGAWTHIAVSHNCDAAANDAIIYVNGSVVAAPGSANPGGTRDSDAALDLTTGNHTGGASTFDGVIDEARLSSTIRTPEWIKASYESGIDDLLAFGVEEELTAAVWDFFTWA